MIRFTRPTSYGTLECDATARDMAELLGLKGASQFPPEGMPPRIIQGYEVWVTPKIGKGMSGLRCYTRCKVCGKTLPVGRLAQHERHVHEGVKHGRKI